MGTRRILMTFFAVAVAAVVVMPYLLQGEDPELDGRRKVIAEMTHAQRERLERNLDQYLRLTESQREEYRQLHAELVSDAANNHGRATESLQTFREWLQTISPRERIELSEVHDSAAKVRLIHEMISRHHDEALEIRSGQPLRRLGPIPSLKPEDMDRVLSLISEAAELEVNRAELEGFEGLRRTLKVFELMGRKNEKLTTLLTEERMKAVLKALSDDSDRRMLEYVADNRPAPPQIGRVKLAITVFKNLEVAVQRELRRQQVTTQALQAVFNELPGAEQDELLKLSASGFRAELRRRHVDASLSGRIDRRYVEQFLRPGRENRPRRRDGTSAKNRRPAVRE